MAAGAFARAFRDKGRLEPLLAGVPVWLVLEPRAPLLGALHVARRDLLGRDP
jgi:glucokinase